MAVSKPNYKMPIVSKMYCSPSQVVLVVRRRPQAVGGGGFVVTNCSQKVVFQVDGCGILGKKGELILRDSDGDAILLIRQLKGGLVQALSLQKKWKGYYDYEGYERSVFSIKEPNANACFPSNNNNSVRISIEPKNTRDWNFEVKGYFPDKNNCSIVDSQGNVVAQ
ncbi:Protein LURP-one-related 6, partial [Bienertia sinuspersici]